MSGWDWEIESEVSSLSGVISLNMEVVKVKSLPSQANGAEDKVYKV